MEIYRVFVVYTFDQKDPAGNFINSTEHQIIAENYQEALIKLEAINPDHQPNIYLKQILENYIHH